MFVMEVVPFVFRTVVSHRVCSLDLSDLKHMWSSAHIGLAILHEKPQYFLVCSMGGDCQSMKVLVSL